uniref:Uncharacterized protein n=1 Tax=Meloidogyne incognita TaxID=6306 RepID=A0A914MM73_MELIC
MDYLFQARVLVRQIGLRGVIPSIPRISACLETLNGGGNVHEIGPFKLIKLMI